MKKALIAGAASVALAAMPVVGVFAAQATNPESVVDTLTVNVNGVCTFERTTGNGTYTQTMAANALNDSFGTSTFTSGCNNGTGYKVTLTATDLAYANGANITYATGETTPDTPTAGSGTWVAYRSAATGGSTVTSYNTAGNIAAGGYAYETNAADGATASTFTVIYKVSTHSIQEQGSYQGTATYTLAQNTAA